MEDSLEKFTPLIGVFGFVIASTAIISTMAEKTALMEIGKIFMGLFFLTFGGFKVYNFEGFKEAFKSYDMLADRFDLYAKGYPFIELGLGSLYLHLSINSNVRLEIFTHSAAITVMTLGGAGVLNELRKGKELQCACLGNVFNVPMTKVTLAEDLVMAAMAVWMLLGVI